jgi:hypothetical protein
MALNLPFTTAETVKVEQVIIPEAARVKVLILNFDTSEAMAIVAQTANGQEITKKIKLKGAFYLSNIQDIAPVVFAKTVSMLQQILTNEALKAQLLASGELEIE